jgi:predicted dehydrogenase
MRHVARQADGLQDNMLAVMETDKALATVKSTAVEVEGGARRHLVVCGTEGTFHIQPIENPVATIALAAPHEDFRAGMQTRSFTQPKYTRYVADAADMAQIIRGEKPSDFSYEHDLAVQRCVLQASGM